LFLYEIAAAVDSTSHPVSMTDRDDDAFGEFLSGMPATTVSLQSSVSQDAASSAVTAGSQIQHDCTAGGAASVKQNQTG